MRSAVVVSLSVMVWCSNSTPMVGLLPGHGQCWHFIKPGGWSLATACSILVPSGFLRYRAQPASLASHC
eukprot:3473438-Karenia_brevis.AAC.1